MRFQVPQFIEMEDKIFGPLTLKQFIYLGGGAGIIVTAFIFLPTFLAVMIAIPVGIFAGALAFYKVNNRPFIHLVESMFRYATKDKLYVWKNTGGSHHIISTQPKEEKLKDMNWSLGIEPDENEEEESDNRPHTR